jgi:hypothetical protein
MVNKRQARVLVFLVRAASSSLDAEYGDVATHREDNDGVSDSFADRLEIGTSCPKFCNGLTY